MNFRVVEIATEGAKLTLSRGFMVVGTPDGGKGRVPIGDIAALVVRGYGTTVSLSLCSKLAESGIPAVLCGADQQPASIIWPVRGHFEQGRRMQAQSEATRPMRKRLWRDIVRVKLENQAAVLEATGGSGERLRNLSRKVRSGDPDNCEASGARYYWPRLMGETFRRDHGGGGVNACLNYGYAILRAGAARAILCAGLHPSLSIFHESRGDALRLADDLMEPFRPFIDLVVARLPEVPSDGPDPELKSRLASVLTFDLEGPKGSRPLQSCLDAMAYSLSQVFLGKADTLELPTSPAPLSLGVM